MVSPPHRTKDTGPPRKELTCHSARWAEAQYGVSQQGTETARTRSRLQHTLASTLAPHPI